MESESLPLVAGSILVFLSLVLGAMMLDTLFNGGTNPRTLVALHVHGLGFGMVMMITGILLRRVGRYSVLKGMAASLLSAGGPLFFAALAFKLAGIPAFIGDSLEIVGAAVFIGGFVTSMVLLDA